ncbi:unnamed protein product [Rangifer tarandus platyrhynchus]|uniref:Uncharacterized protein n=1 Tax=Rangifer tarandus platyrhynchus TaxID=3082113 RepID=A0AC59Z9E9_RANTA
MLKVVKKTSYPCCQLSVPGWSLPCWPGPSTVHHSIVTHASSCLPQALSISAKGSSRPPTCGGGSAQSGSLAELAG